MKLLVYVLSALLIVSSIRAQDTPNKESYDISQLEYDTQATEALKEGINWVYSQAAEKYDISGLNIDVTKVNKIDTWEDNGDTYYDFDIESENADAYVNSTYSVRCFDNGEYRVVNDWQYTLDRKGDNEEEQDSNYDDNDDDDNYNTDEDDQLPDYNTNVELILGEGESENENENECVEEDSNVCKKGTQVDASEINTDAQLRDALSHGITWIFEQANEKYGIANDQITVKRVNTICAWKVNENSYWYFDVEASNTDDETVKATYNVKWEADSEEFRVVNEWSYVIDYPDDDDEEDKTEEKDSYVDDTPDQDTDVYQDDDEEEMDIEVEIDTDVYDANTDNDDDTNDNPYPDNNDDDTNDNPYPDNNDDDDDDYPDNNDDDTNDNPYPDNNDDDTNDNPYPDNSGNDDDDADPYPENGDDGNNGNPYPEDNDDDTNDNPYPNNN